MEWILKMIAPVIAECSTPTQAREAIIKWGKSQEPRDAAAALIAIDIINNQYHNAQTTLTT